MKTLADISGNNAVHALTADTSLTATVVYLGAVGGPARVGDLANVSSSRGASIESGKITILPPKLPEQKGYYQLSKIGVYVPNGTTLTITYDNE